MFYSHHALGLTLPSSFEAAVCSSGSVMQSNAGTLPETQNSHAHTRTPTKTKTQARRHSARSILKHYSRHVRTSRVLPSQVERCTSPRGWTPSEERTVMSQSTHSNSDSACWVWSSNHLVNHYSWLGINGETCCWARVEGRVRERVRMLNCYQGCC